MGCQGRMLSEDPGVHPTSPKQSVKSAHQLLPGHTLGFVPVTIVVVHTFSTPHYPAMASSSLSFLPSVIPEKHSPVLHPYKSIISTACDTDTVHFVEGPEFV